MESSKKCSLILLGVGVVLLAVGVIFYLQQLQNGVPATNDFPFGIYLSLFFCLAGAAAGLLFANFGAEFGFLPEHKGVGKLLAAGAVALLVAAGLVITFLDCGQPSRVFNMLVNSSPVSLVSWDFYFLLATVILAVVCIFVRNKVVSAIAAFSALAVIVVEALILVVTSGMEHWNNPMLVGTFLAEAIILAFSMILLASPKDNKRVKVVLVIALAVTLVLAIGDLIAGLYGREVSTSLLVNGQFAGLYWTMLIAGVVLPLIALLVPQLPAAGASVAAALAIAGVFLSKLVTLLAGEAITVSGEIAVYVPETMEFFCALGGIGVAFVIYALLKLVLAPKKAVAAEAAAEEKAAE